MKYAHPEPTDFRSQTGSKMYGKFNEAKNFVQFVYRPTGGQQDHPGDASQVLTDALYLTTVVDTY